MSLEASGSGNGISKAEFSPLSLCHVIGYIKQLSCEIWDSPGSSFPVLQSKTKRAAGAALGAPVLCPISGSCEREDSL